MPTSSIRQLPKTEMILPGTRSCAGCGLMLTYRHALKALDEGKTIVAVPASCMTVLHGVYPITPVKVVCINNPFAATGARIVGSLAKMLHQKGSGRGLISICTAGGMGVAAILEAV